jgi:hypothetical protein
MIGTMDDTQSTSNGRLHIPLSAEIQSDYWSVSVKDLITYLAQERHVRNVLQDRGLVLSGPLGLDERGQFFDIAPMRNRRAGTHASGASAGDADPPSGKRPIETVQEHLAIVRSQPDRGTDKTTAATGSDRKDGDAMELLESSVDRARNQLAKGPKYVVLDDVLTPWSDGLVKPVRTPLRPPVTSVTLKLISEEHHLRSFNNNRYLLGDASAVASVEIGSSLLIDGCRTSRVYFAEADAFSVQLELISPTDQPQHPEAQQQSR